MLWIDKISESFNDILGTMTREERKENYEKIRSDSSPSPSFYMMVCVSTIIATYGLLAESTAVVIGAMLVAPLMNPIFGIALGLSSGDNTLLKNAVASEFLGMLLAISLGVLIGLVPLRPDFGPEIISRTQPSIYDVIIALASGLAGSYALVNKKLSPALPGVAISTALVPPLATCGLCLAARNYDWALGAFMLFVVNLVAIEFAAAAVYAASGLVKWERDNGWAVITFLRRFGLSLLILIVMGVFMTQTLVQIASERTLDNKLTTLVSEQVKSTIGASLSELRYEKEGDALQIMAVVMTPHEFDHQRVADIEKVIQDEINPNSYLIVRSLISNDADRNGQVFISEDEKMELTRQLSFNQLQSETTMILNEELGKLPGARVASIDINDVLDDGMDISVEVHTPTPIEPLQVSRMEDKLNTNLDEPVRLTIRSILTHDADNTMYLYEEGTRAEPLTGPALEFYNKLESAIKKQLYEQEPAAKLLEFYYGEKNNDLLVLLQIRSPHTMGPKDVLLMEHALQSQVDERIKVIIRFTVGADTSVDYYLTGYDENLAKALLP